jgi:biopolymer transport protein ExbB
MVRMGRIVLLGGVLLAGALGSTLALGQAQEPDAQAAAPRGIGIGRESLLRLVQHANPLLWPLLVCSVVMVAYIFERALALRHGRVIPREFGKRFLERLAQGKLDRERGIELCRANDSPLARVFGHVMRYWSQPAATITQAIDHDSAGELLALRKHVRVLNATATIAPLLGLLGTVVGMIESFDAVGGGRVGGESRSEALAHGISVALITTGVGLVLAVISVAFYYYFLQKIDNLVRELDDKARQAIDLISAETLRGAAGVTSFRGPLGGPASDLGGPEPPRSAGRSLGRVDTL